MPIRKVWTETDPLANTQIDYHYDTDAMKLHMHRMVEVTQLLKICKFMRQNEGSKRVKKFFGSKYDGMGKWVASLPPTIFADHPEFVYDRNAMLKWLEENPDFKTTNAKLIRPKG